MGHRRDVLLGGALAGSALAYATLVVWHGAARGWTLPNFDSYGYFYPSVRYALESLARGGEGLLWNPYQNCGQPFLGMSLTGALYPPYLLMLLGPEAGWVALLAFHLFVGGAGTYLLCREMDLGPPAAWCGALSFQLGGLTLLMASWSPAFAGSYVWMPAALFLTERALRRPTFAVAAALAAVVAIQLSAGFPQFTLFIYMAIGLRVLWEIATRRARPWRGMLAIGAGALLGPALAAVQLLPALEVASVSLRSLPLGDREIFPPNHLTVEAFRRLVGRAGWGGVLAAPVIALAALALLDRRRARLAVFYIALGALCFTLAFDTPVLRALLDLPQGRMFRMPNRFLIVTGLALAVLAGFGAQWAFEPGRRRHPAQVLLPLAALAMLAVLVPGGGIRVEWAAAAGVVVVLGVVVAAPRRAASAWILPLCLVASLVAVGLSMRSGMWGRTAEIVRNAAAFDALAARMTSQDRVFLLARHPDYALMPKSAAIFHVRSIGDYEPQTSRRFATLKVALRADVPLESVNQYYFRGLAENPANPRVLDLLGARYLLVDARRWGQPPWPADAVPLWRDGPLAIFENRQALPRARVVARAVTMPRPEDVLDAITRGTVDLRDTVLLEAPVEAPPLESDAPIGGGAAAIVRDASEEVVIEVRAPRPGFLVLTDQDYPGWEASVNGAPAPILRADYAFRAVQVPAGASTVVFRYRPLSLRAGAVISALTMLAMLLGLVLTWHRRARRAAPVA